MVGDIWQDPPMAEITAAVTRPGTSRALVNWLEEDTGDHLGNPWADATNRPLEVTRRSPSRPYARPYCRRPVLSRTVPEAHQSPHHLREHGHRETPMARLPSPGGQGVAGSNPVSPT